MKRLFCLLGLVFSAYPISAEVPSGPAVGTIAPDSHSPHRFLKCNEVK